MPRMHSALFGHPSVSFIKLVISRDKIHETRMWTVMSNFTTQKMLMAIEQT